MKQDSISFIYRNVVNSYISDKVDTWSHDWKKDFTLSNCLSGAVNSTLNDDFAEYSYNGYGIGLDERPHPSYQKVIGVRIMLFFGVNNSSSMYVDTRK